MCSSNMSSLTPLSAGLAFSCLESLWTERPPTSTVWLSQRLTATLEGWGTALVFLNHWFDSSGLTTLKHFKHIKLKKDHLIQARISSENLAYWTQVLHSPGQSNSAFELTIESNTLWFLSDIHKICCSSGSQQHIRCAKPMWRQNIKGWLLQ